MTKCVVLSPEALLSRARCFCLDCDKGTVWVVTSNALCCIEEGKVNLFIKSAKVVSPIVLKTSGSAVK